MSDQERWDEKYRQANSRPMSPADHFLLAALERLGAGAGRRALDLACGLGRHALELARSGWEVEAWDVSHVGLQQLEENAKQAGLPVTGRQVDLCLPLPIADPGFDLIVLINYLDRELLTRVPQLLRTGGQLVFVTFTTDREGQHPSDRHCLHPAEYASGLPGLRNQVHEEQRGRAGFQAVKV